MRSQLVRGIGGAAMAVGLACSVVACSSGESSSGTSSTGTSSAAVEGGAPPAAMSDELQACLEENGVPAPPDQAGGGAPGGMAPPSGEMTPPEGGDGSTPPEGGTPDASSTPPGVDGSTWAAAQEACSGGAGS
ncbi:hypothetical protein [Rhodococcus opacus]|uniref:hypothetical protein n=2 Tax=Rhodococcus TaxID=1827 RepID=UPI00042EA0BD|nr:hypothetical protein [Rhodococcus opacus]AHK29739.1 hypothetical protein Pd630_LPD02516 [Rhodococcus opacus PD630]